MTLTTIAVMSPGDMGHAVGRAVRERGFRVITALADRSAHSCTLAEQGGLEDVGTLADLVAAADLILSIMPPSAARGFAEAAAAAIGEAGVAPLFVDCNAIAPNTARAIAAIVGAAGAEFVDGGIIGSPPGIAAAPRLYVSGGGAERLHVFDGPTLKVVPLGPEIGRASALKMCYAALTKGTMTLDTAVLLAGAQLGVSAELAAEFAESQSAAWARMGKRVPWLAGNAGRWIGEMEEIAATFAAADLPDGFHLAAAEIFRLLAATPLAAETRETADRGRTLYETLEVFGAGLAAPRDAAQ